MERSVETLRQGHEQELELQRAAHCREITRIQQLLDTSENEVIRLELVLQKEQESRRQAEELVGARGAFDNSLDISQIEREAAEGQEVDPNQHQTMAPGSSVTSPLPLEQLLAQTEAYSELTAEGLRSSNSSRIGGAEKQVTHLAALLSESEAQNSRLEKLTEVLKEEIRTYQRSEERYKHIENLEYIKNVFLKFLTRWGSSGCSSCS